MLYSTIILIKYFPCETKAELDAEEFKYIQNIDCVNTYTGASLDPDYKKKWGIKNKQYVSDYDKLQYAKKSKEKYTCVCGSTIRILYKSKHEQSKKHKLSINL